MWDVTKEPSCDMRLSKAIVCNCSIVKGARAPGEGEQQHQRDAREAMELCTSALTPQLHHSTKVVRKRCRHLRGQGVEEVYQGG